MQVIRMIFPGMVCLFSFSFVQAQAGSDLNRQDSTMLAEADPTVLFFRQHEKVTSPASVKLVTKSNKTESLESFLKTTGIYADHVLADLDRDGRKELLISNYTGGAHCCDEIFIFRNIAPGRYQYAAKFFAGNTTISGNSEFIYDFSQQFGYFFTCFACAYTDTSDAAPIGIHNIVLTYNKGKMTVVPGDRELRSTIMDNLEKLGELPYEKPEDEGAQDNGQRKEFAINLAVFYYAYGRNLTETQKLFNKYYKYPDAKKVWTAFVKQLQSLIKDNDF